MQKQKILIVDDDANISELISLYLQKECFETKCVENGIDALAAFRSFSPDLILLDLMLPGMDGYEVCRNIRRSSSTPIIMLSAKGEVFDKVLGLELGADDYMIKPFDSKELVARVKAVLRRTAGSDSSQQNTNRQVVTFPGLTVDLTNYSVTCDGRTLDMPPKELELLFFLASNPNRVFTREQLLENVWGYDFYGESRTVDVHVKRIREKIENPNREQNWCIKTVWSKGYKFETK